MAEPQGNVIDVHQEKIAAGADEMDDMKTNKASENINDSESNIDIEIPSNFSDPSENWTEHQKGIEACVNNHTSSSYINRSNNIAHEQNPYTTLEG